MDITGFIVTHRADALMIGDYNQYRALLTRRLHTLGKRLGRTTPKGKKFTKKGTITADNIATDTGYVYLLLLGAERAWATAMHMRSIHSADTSKKGMVGSARRHIISRFNKATTYANQLVSLLQDRSTSQSSGLELLEARAYLASLSASFWLEKRRWDQCLKQVSLARVIYTALESKGNQERIRDFLSGTIDPSIRYAAHQLKLSRSIPLDNIAKEYFPTDPKLRAEVEAFDPEFLNEKGSSSDVTAEGGSQALPQTITWRSRTVKLEDASISQALAAASTAESQLSTWISSSSGQAASWKEKAANYDNVIIASQDAVDATKTAIDDLASEGIDQGDTRVQSLQVTRTAVNYTLVGWRVGRNRVLCGDRDGLDFESDNSKRTKKSKTQSKSKEESVGRRIGVLRERVVLYDAMLQSLEFVKELPGVAADTSFVTELEAKRCYFQALRCLAIGRSHAFRSHPKNALALFARALDLISKCLSASPTPSDGSNRPPQLDISGSQMEALHSQLQHFVWQYRGIVEIEKLTLEVNTTNQAALPPMIERLGEYPLEGVDLNNLVTYPPKLEPIPVKPLFLDVAWNYIDYPNDGKKALPSAPDTATETAPVAEVKKETKKGWFGFGR